MRHIMLRAIALYQRFLSPMLAPRCRYLPTCSEYARQCFIELPLHTALWHTFARVLSCHPWSAGGYDPIPTNSQPSSQTTTENTKP